MNIFLKSNDKSTGNVIKKTFFENFSSHLRRINNARKKLFLKSFMVLVGAKIGGTGAGIYPSIFYGSNN